MAFTKLSNAGAGSGAAAGSSATVEPGIWATFQALRDVREVFGLRPGHVQTLQALLSFLRPGQGETVFASNREICRRVGGIDERTLRRHIDRFVSIGFMTRHDSPNNKRYRVRSSNGDCMSFGLSLAPFIARSSEILALGQEVENSRRDQMFLRKKILAQLARLAEVDPENTVASDIRAALRRKLALADYGVMLSAVEAECGGMSTAEDMPETIQLPANDGQTARHQSKSKQGTIDLQRQTKATAPEVRSLIAACDQARSFAASPLRSWEDAQVHARYLAPMMGITEPTYQRTAEKVGAKRATCAIFLMLQFSSRVRDFGAYFQSITVGRRAAQFDPSALLARLDRYDAELA